VSDLVVSDEDLVATFAGHTIDGDSAPHFRGRLRHELLIQQCEDCDRWNYPPRPICPNCWSSSLVYRAVAGTGVVYLATFLHLGPAIPGVSYDPPYPVVSVELDDAPGVRFTGTAIGIAGERSVIGSRAELTWVDRAGVPVPTFVIDQQETLVGASDANER
jgi:uncharacterized OB-fold protein